jgi:hypothetical protein
VENGELAMGKRHDERTGHKVNAYWRIAKDWENGLDERTPQAE